MVKVNSRLSKLHFSMHFWSRLSKWAISWHQINYAFPDLLSEWPKYRLMHGTLLAMTSPPKPANVANDASWTL